MSRNLIFPFRRYINIRTTVVVADVFFKRIPYCFIQRFFDTILSIRNVI